MKEITKERFEELAAREGVRVGTGTSHRTLEESKWKDVRVTEMVGRALPAPGLRTTEIRGLVAVAHTDLTTGETTYHEEKPFDRSKVTGRLLESVERYEKELESGDSFVDEGAEIYGSLS
jgi:hypothetical protein